jgi:hypothetical protein
MNQCLMQMFYCQCVNLNKLLWTQKDMKTFVNVKFHLKVVVDHGRCLIMLHFYQTKHLVLPLLQIENAL